MSVLCLKLYDSKVGMWVQGLWKSRVERGKTVDVPLEADSS